MSIHVEVELTCNGPDGVSRFACATPSIFHVDAKHARAEARRRGWSVSRVGGYDLCPECLAALRGAA